MAQTEILADINSACGVEPSLVCDLVHGWTDSDVAAKLAEWLVEKPLTVVIIMFFAWILTLIAKRAIERAIVRLIASRETHDQVKITTRALEFLPGRASAKLDELKVQNERANQRATTLGAVLKSMTAGVIWVMAALIALGEVGISLGPLIAGAGIAGIAIGFGAQSLVKDFLAGIFIVIEDQYGVGDIVDVGEAAGTIEQVTLRTTRLRDVEGALWVVPNGEIRRVGNKSQIWSRAILDIGVSYDTDLDQAAEILKQVADELWHEQREGETVLEEPAVWGVQELGDSAIVLRLAVKTDPAEQWATGRLLRLRIKKAFDLAGIEIPFPQRTVWVKNDTMPPNTMPT
jgi:small-conductance mechanosensitive channel